jgi:hypothetical protein
MITTGVLDEAMRPQRKIKLMALFHYRKYVLLCVHGALARKEKSVIWRSVINPRDRIAA